MAINFDPSDDLITSADGTESVTLLRRGRTPGSSGTTIAHALRRAITAGQAAVVSTGDVRKRVVSDGRYMGADVVWHLPAAELTDPPRLGDVIRDGAGQRWTILTVKKATLGTRWRCETRDVAIAYGLDDTIAVLKADGANWQTWLTGIRARVQPLYTTIDADEEAPSTTTRYRIFVEEELELDHTCCIRGPDGTLHAILRTIGAERIGELQVIETEVVNSSG